MPEKVCPVWIGHLLASPLRRLVQNPKKILEPYVRNGITVLDFGCAMGFFSLPLVHMVGSNGKVIIAKLRIGRSQVVLLEKQTDESNNKGVTDLNLMLPRIRKR